MSVQLRVLVIRFSSMGDIALTSPVITCLRYFFGDNINITVLTKASFSQLYKDHPLIDKVISHVPQRGIADLRALKKTLSREDKEQRFDFIVDAHGTLRSWLIRCLFFSRPHYLINKRRLERLLWIKLKWDFYPRRPDPWNRYPSLQGELVGEKWCKDFFRIFGQTFSHEFSREVLKSRGESIDVSQVSYLKAPDISFSDLFAQTSFKKYFVVFPAAAHSPKLWPAEYYRDLLAKFASDVELKDWGAIILAGPQDNFCSIFDNLAKSFSGRVFNLQGKTNLDTSLAITAKSALSLGNDTGMGHIGEAYGVPSLMLLGPTSESWGFVPHLRHSRYLATYPRCRPCSPNGSRSCTTPGRPCLTNLSIEVVYAQLKRMLLRI